MSGKLRPIDDLYYKEICKIGQGHDCCRYLAADKDGLCCLKNSPDFKTQVDKRVAEKSFTARADNCEGWESVWRRKKINEN